MSAPSKPDQQVLKKSLLLLPAFESSDVERLWELVLGKMTLLFYPPFRADSQNELLDQCIVGLTDYIEALKGFSNLAIEEGWGQVRNNHRTPRWPIIGDLVAACRSYQTPRAIPAAVVVARLGQSEPRSVRHQGFAEASFDGLKALARQQKVDDGTLFRWLRDTGRQPEAEDWVEMAESSARIGAIMGRFSSRCGRQGNRG